MKILARFPELAAKTKSEHLHDLIADVSAVEYSDLPGANLEERSVVIAERISNGEALKAFFNPNVRHILRADRTDVMSELILSCMISKNPDGFIADPINRCLESLGTDTKNRTFSGTVFSTQKQAKLLEDLKNFLAQAPETRHVWSSVVLAADELLSNALFNAPTDENRKPRNKMLPRDGKIEVSETTHLFVVHNDSRLVVGCDDSFGSVNREDLLRKLIRLYSEGPADIDVNQVSAGLGCKMTIDCSTGFYMIVKSHKKTLALCTLDLKATDVENIDAPKHLHFCFW